MYSHAHYLEEWTSVIIVYSGMLKRLRLRTLLRNVVLCYQLYIGIMTCFVVKQPNGSLVYICVA